MASHKERKIVHVKDIFGGEGGKEDEDTNEGDYFFFTDSNQNELPEKPKIVQGSNSDIFFGNTAALEDTENNPLKKKRPAPKPPGMSVMEQLGEWGEPGEYGSVTNDGPGAGDAGSKLSPESGPGAGQDKVPTGDILNRDHGGGTSQLDSSALMNSYQKGLSESNSSNSSKATRSSLDQSSSGIETDDNSTPQGTLASPPVKVTQDNYVSEQEHDILSEEDEFEEDEMTLDFGEEEDPVEGRHRQLYKEYQGEDYSQYIKDDGDLPPPNHKVKKRMKKRKGAKPPLSPTSTSSASSGENHHKGFKTRISQVFGVGGSHKSRSGSVIGLSTTNNLQSFTYAESRIGQSVTDKDIDHSVFSTRTTMSEGSIANLGPEGSPTALTKRWWSKDMLSARTLDSNTDVLLKASISHIPAGEVDLDSGVVYNADSKDQKFHDFESYRKNAMYDTTKSKGRRSRKSGLWKKLTGSLRRGDHSDYESGDDNTTSNPLTQVDYGDVRL